VSTMYKHYRAGGDVTDAEMNTLIQEADRRSGYC